MPEEREKGLNKNRNGMSRRRKLKREGEIITCAGPQLFFKIKQVRLCVSVEVAETQMSKMKKKRRTLPTEHQNLI